MFPSERSAVSLHPSAAAIGRTMRKLRARNAATIRRRRMHAVPIDRHHLSEQSSG